MTAARRSVGMPLAGRRILVTRPRAQSRPLCDRLRRLGARALAVPTIEILPPPPGGPLDRALRSLAHYDWVIATSANGARTCIARAQALGVDLRATPGPSWAAIGPATASVLRRAGIGVTMTPSRYLTEAIARELPDVRNCRILLPRTDAAPPGLAGVLRQRGALVDEVAAYRTVVGPPQAAARLRRVFARRHVDTVLFTSASTVRGLMRLLGDRRPLEGLAIACIGPVTADAAVTAGLRPTIIAMEHTIDGLITALVAARAPRLPRRAEGERHAKDRVAR